jgi:integrase/recombinase XerD
MTTAAPSTALATIQPAFTDPERLALAGYRGLTRDACTLDLRQFTTWCRARSLPLFTVRRRHRKLRPRPGDQGPGPRHRHPPAVHHRRVLPLRRRGRTPGALTGCPRPATAGGLRVARRRAGPQRARRPAGRRRARLAGRAYANLLLALNGLRVSEATGADLEHLGLERGHRTMTITH